MKSFKQFLKENYPPFAIPDYPMQKDNVKYIDGDWAIGEEDKAYVYDTSKSGEENLKDMGDLVKKGRGE